MNATVLLDLGCNNTNISENLANFMGMRSIKGPVERTLNVMGGKQIQLTSSLVQFEISPIKPLKALEKFVVEAKTRFPVKAWTMKEVCGRTSLVDWKVKKQQFSRLKKICQSPDWAIMIR